MEITLELKAPMLHDRAEVLVFKTSVQSHEEASWLTPLLDELAGEGTWNFALDDCDRILRVVSHALTAQHVMRLLIDNGFTCEELAD